MDEKFKWKSHAELYFTLEKQNELCVKKHNTMNAKLVGECSHKKIKIRTGDKMFGRRHPITYKRLWCTWQNARSDDRTRGERGINWNSYWIKLPPSPEHTPRSLAIVYVFYSRRCNTFCFKHISDVKIGRKYADKFEYFSKYLIWWKSCCSNSNGIVLWVMQ